MDGCEAKVNTHAHSSNNPDNPDSPDSPDSPGDLDSEPADV